MRVCLTVVAVLAVTGLASAAVAPVVTDLGMPMGVPPGYTAYKVSFVADTQADRITAFEGRFDGLMHQIWPFSMVIFMHEPVLYGGEIGGDTHLLLSPADVTAPASTSPMEEAPPLIPNTTSVGDTTWFAHDAATPMAFSIALTAYDDVNDWDVDLMYLVIPDGAEAVMTGKYATETSGTQTFPIDPPVLIPEPLTVSLIGLGALALLRRRR